MSFKQQKQDWEDLGILDPLWAVLSNPRFRFGRWNPDELFRSGEQVIREVMANGERLGRPAGRERALDFGCGVGRLTRALSPHFHHCLGIDISASRVERARALNESCSNCHFLINWEDDLGMLADDSFDLAVTFRVLQRQPQVLGEGALAGAVEAGDPDADLVLAALVHTCACAQCRCGQLHLAQQLLELRLHAVGDDVFGDLGPQPHFPPIGGRAVGDHLLDGAAGCPWMGRRGI